MLKFHFFNVGHGDSTVVELCTTEGSLFSVIDCFKDEEGKYPALDFLKSRGAENIVFLALTHPHADHYVGLGEIARNFTGKIDSYFTFPVHRTPEKLKQLAGQYARPEKLPTAALAKPNLEFLNFILAAKESQVWEDCSVNSINKLHVPRFAGVEISVLLPPAKVKGEILDSWANGVVGASSTRLNELSIALLFKYAGCQVIICGDATSANFTFMRRRWGSLLDPIAVKIPHHGSGIDCSSDVLDVLFPAQTSVVGDRYAFISANGKSHPNSTVLTNLVAKCIKPYCTNLATRCGGVVSPSNKIDDPITPDLRRSLSVFANEPARVRPCQGNMCLSIFSDGTYSVDRQYKNICPLRGELDFLPGGAEGGTAN